MTNELSATNGSGNPGLVSRSPIDQYLAVVNVIQDVGFLVLPVFIGRSVQVSEAMDIEQSVVDFSPK